MCNRSSYFGQSNAHSSLGILSKKRGVVAENRKIKQAKTPLTADWLLECITLNYIWSTHDYLKGIILVKSLAFGRELFIIEFSSVGFSSHKDIIWLNCFNLVNSGQYSWAWLRGRSSVFHTVVLYTALSWWSIYRTYVYILCCWIFPLVVAKYIFWNFLF